MGTATRIKLVPYHATITVNLYICKNTAQLSVYGKIRHNKMYHSGVVFSYLPYLVPA